MNLDDFLWVQSKPSYATTVDELRQGGGTMFPTKQPSPELAASDEYQEYKAEQAERRARYEAESAKRYAEEKARSDERAAATRASLTTCIGLTITAVELFAGDGACGFDVDSLRLVLSDGRTITAVGEGYDEWGIAVEVQA